MSTLMQDLVDVTYSPGVHRQCLDPNKNILSWGVWTNALVLLSRKMPGGKATSLCEAIGWENSREHSDINYTVYALRFMSLTRQVIVVCAGRIWRVHGKDLSLSCRHNSLLPCCKSSGGRGASAILRANLTTCGTWGCGGSDKTFCKPSFVFRNVLFFPQEMNQQIISSQKMHHTHTHTHLQFT